MRLWYYGCLPLSVVDVCECRYPPTVGEKEAEMRVGLVVLQERERR